MKKTPKTLGELSGQDDMTGFIPAEVYYLELDHSLSGIFPALIKSTDEIVICLDEELLKRIEHLLSHRPYKKGRFLALVHLEGGFGFNPESLRGKETPLFRILTKDDFIELLATERNPFKWAPGLVGPGMDQEEFSDTLKEALEQRQN